MGKTKPNKVIVTPKQQLQDINYQKFNRKL